MNRLATLAILFFLPFLATAQTPFALKIRAAEAERAQLAAHFSKKKSTDSTFLFQLADSLAAVRFLEKQLADFHENGFLLASADSVFWKKGSCEALISVGKKFKWVELRTGPLEQNLLEEIGATHFLKNAKNDPAKIFDLEQNLMQHLENQGFAFARIWLDSLEMDSAGGLRARLNALEGPFFTFDKPILDGDASISMSYLTQFLGLKIGAPYRFSQVQKITTRLRSSAFLDAAREPIVSFSKDNRATVKLFLKKKRASRFDFLLGFLPKPASDATAGRLLLTGQFVAEFQNALGRGERIFAEIQRLRPETQRLDLEAAYPYFLGQPFGFDGRLHLYKRDSTYLDFQANAGVQYLLEGGDFVKLFWETTASNLLKINVLELQTTRRLPQNLDSKIQTFGLETLTNRLDYRFNPRRGFSLKTKVGAGFKTTLRNSEILKLSDATTDFSSQYDSLGGRSTVARGEVRADFFIPILSRSTLKLGVFGGGIFSSKPIFQNEQMRLGGHKMLRGYDEESIFATRFLVGTAEFRLLIGPNSFLSAFSDFGYVENLTNRTTQFLHPLGFGAGLNFETKAGIFGLSLAVGRPENGGFDVRSPKVHLGYVSLF